MALEEKKCKFLLKSSRLLLGIDWTNKEHVYSNYELESAYQKFKFKTLCTIVIVQGFGHKRQIVKMH